MAKPRPVLACSDCGHQTSQWVGRCPGCGAWGTIDQARGSTPGVDKAEPLVSDTRPHERLRTGLPGFDRVLGGGLVRGSVVLLAGAPGIGKSTLLLQIADALAGSGCLVASGEESREQVASRAARLGLEADSLAFVSGRELPTVIDAARAQRPAVLVVDSIQAIRDPELPSLPGGPAQVRACADAVVGLAKAEGIVVILVGQVTKEGDLAGPRTLEHAVDAVCSFEGDATTGLRVLAGGKNRFGAEGEVAWFEMAGEGLREVDPARLLASPEPEVGAATALVTAGRRALALQVQALVPLVEGPPRRQVSGLDVRRFGLVAAVVEHAAGHRLSRGELYGAAAGGIHVDDPGADLAIAAALASSAAGTAPPAATAFCGEVSLTGAVRPASGLPQRLSAAKAAGIETVVGPPAGSAPAGVRIVPVRHVREALQWSKRGRGAAA